METCSCFGRFPMRYRHKGHGALLYLLGLVPRAIHTLCSNSFYGSENHHHEMPFLSENPIVYPLFLVCSNWRVTTYGCWF